MPTREESVLEEMIADSLTVMEALHPGEEEERLAAPLEFATITSLACVIAEQTADSFMKITQEAEEEAELSAEAEVFSNLPATRVKVRATHSSEVNVTEATTADSTTTWEVEWEVEWETEDIPADHRARAFASSSKEVNVTAEMDAGILVTEIIHTLPYIYIYTIYPVYTIYPYTLSLCPITYHSLCFFVL